MSTSQNEAAFQDFMDIEAAVVQIEGWAESDWIGLWEITAYVGDEMGEPDSEERQIELIVSIVKGLLQRGLCAGDSPLTNLGPRFLPWRNPGATGPGSRLHASAVSMPELDRLKERLAYAKFWLGIIVITDIGLVGWLISSVDDAQPLRLLLALLGVILLTFAGWLLHQQIDQRMEQIGRL